MTLFGAFGILGLQPLAHAADFERDQHAPGDRFAVQNRSKAGDGFNRMADGVAEIENHPQPGFFFVQTDDLGLHANGCGDNLFERLWIAPVNERSIGFDEAKEAGVPDESGLDALVKPSAQLSLGKGAQQIDVREDGARMVKRTHKVLARAQIYPGLAPDGGIDLSEQRGGYLHVVDAPHVDGGKKAAHIANDAAAKGKQQRRAVRPCAGHLRAQPLDLAQALVALAAGEKENDGLDRHRRRPVSAGPRATRSRARSRRRDSFALCRRASAGGLRAILRGRFRRIRHTPPSLWLRRSCGSSGHLTSSV